MDLATKIKSLLKGAEVYKGQGLLIEARENYRSALRLIEAQSQVKNREALLQGLAEKLERLEAEIHKVENAPVTQEVSAATQDLIKRLFAFSPQQDEEGAVLEGAIALTKFGQYGRAMEEFESLLDRERLRLVAAKNIMRCHLATDAVEAATEQYAAWMNDERFPPDLIGKVKTFLEMLLRKRDVEVTLPEPATAEEDEVPLVEIDVEAPAENEVLDISAVAFRVPSGPRADRALNYEVSFQSGNVVSILINEQDKAVAEALHMGERLAEVEFTSPMAIFTGSAKIMEKNQIKVGPRKGFFSVDLKIDSN